jgi:type II secretory pathway pseudopilin PulG
MRHTRRGFTVIELVIVCVLVGGLTLMTMPRIGTMRDTYGVQAAKQQLAAALATARTAAVQKGRLARFRANGNVFSAVVDTSSSDSIYVIRPKNLGTEFGVTLELRVPGDSVLRFDSRGFRTTPRTAATQVYVLRRGASRDSVCLGMRGQLLTRGCTL